MKKKLLTSTIFCMLLIGCSNYKLSKSQQTNLNQISTAQAGTTSNSALANNKQDNAIFQPVIINKSNAVAGSFNVNSKFAKLYPNFLNDGKYYWNGNDVKDFSAAFCLDINNNFPKFSYKDYPATLTRSSNDLNGFNVLVTYGSLNHDDFFFKYAKNGFKNAGIYYFSQYDQLSCPEGYMITDEAKKIYNSMNEKFKGVANNYLKQKTNGSIQTGNLASFDYSKNIIDVNTIIFEIRNDNFYISANPNSYLGYNSFTLVVKNAYGDSISSYKQAIFGDVYCNAAGKGATIQVEFHNQCFANALPSLINQFLNDNNAKAQIGTFALQHKNDDKDIVSQNVLYGALLSRKAEVKTLCADAKISFDNVIDVAGTSPNTPRYVPNSSVSDGVNKSAEALGNMASNAISNLMNKNADKLANVKSDFVVSQVSAIKLKEMNLLDNIAALPQTVEKDALMMRVYNNSFEMRDALDQLKSAKEKSKKAVTH